MRKEITAINVVITYWSRNTLQNCVELGLSENTHVTMSATTRRGTNANGISGKPVQRNHQKDFVNSPQNVEAGEA